jgi:mannose-6-phosphate isomerase-like protein (cupin superfamily)
MVQMKVVNVEELQPVSLPGHFKILNKRIIGADVGAKNVEVLLGIAEAGGGSKMHGHSGTEQVFYVIDGVLKIKNGNGEEVELKKGMAAYIPPGELHQPYNSGSSRTIYLVINSPPVVRTH